MSFNELIIQMVHESPCIYDSRSNLHKDPKLKEDAWRNISQCSGQPVETCMKRWKSLRDRFAKEKRKIENAQKSGNVKNFSLWEHYEPLIFLQDHLRHKVTVGDLSRFSSSVIDFTQEETVSEDEAITLGVVGEESDSAASSSASGPLTSRQAKKRKRSDQMDIQESISDMQRQNMENISQLTGRRNDEFTHFGNFVASSLRNMPQAKAYESIAVISQHLASQRWRQSHHWFESPGRKRQTGSLRTNVTATPCQPQPSTESDVQSP